MPAGAGCLGRHKQMYANINPGRALAQATIAAKTGLQGMLNMWNVLAWHRSYTHLLMRAQILHQLLAGL